MKTNKRTVVSHKTRKGCALGCAFVALGSAVVGYAQEDEAFLSQTGPRMPYSSPTPSRYNIKWRDITARFSAYAQFEYNDNVNLSQTNPKTDFSIAPNIGLGFQYPLSREHVLHLDFDLGYRWYVNSPSVNSLFVSPNSVLEHNIYLEDWHFNIHDKFRIQSDPASQAELSGTGTDLVRFQLLDNRLGMMGDWRPYRDLTAYAGYDYGINRSLTSDFELMDRDDHSFVAGADYNFTPRLTVGIMGNYSLEYYLKNIQNDASFWSVGPVAYYRATRFISFDARAGITTSSVDPTGTIADTSEFSGFVWSLGAQHTINSKMSHNLRFSRTASSGIYGNILDTMILQYGYRVRLTSAVTLNATVAYETYDVSGPLGDSGDRYLFSLASGYQLDRYWKVGLEYAFALKNSSLPNRDYTQNRITVNLTRQF